MPGASPVRVGLISDTHGLLRPEALDALRGCDHLVHAGDIGGPEILQALRAMAPLTVVRGNNDRGAWAADVPETIDVTVGGVCLRVLHDLAQLPALAPLVPGDGVRVVVAGHAHRPRIEDRAGVLFVNPGSAGPRRFRLPVTVGELVVDGGEVRARVTELFLTPGGPGSA